MEWYVMVCIGMYWYAWMDGWVDGWMDERMNVFM
jgi:hypothetical protein